MKTISLILTLCIGITAFGYDEKDFMRDATQKPIGIFRNLHPDSKDYLLKCMKRIREDSDYREFVFYDQPKGLKKMNDEKLWMALWEEHIGNDFYDVDSAKIVGTFELDTRKLYIFEDPSFSEAGGVFDEIVFKKHGDEFLPTLPEIIAVSLLDEW